MSASGIKTMKLYHQVERVFNELSALGVAPDGPIDVCELVAFDQYHYLGTDAVDEAVRRLDLNPSLHVLEVGSGIGGPSRHLAHACGCRMTALELQPDLHETAVALTARCGLDERVRHVCGNVLDGVTPGSFDALVSWLTFLHIPQRARLYARCFEALKPGGGLYVEDYFERARLCEAERTVLAREVYCEHVPSMNDYRTELRAAGFEDLELIDMSDAWTDFVQERWSAFRARRERNLQLHGEAIVDGLDGFYGAIVSLFAGGNLGGIRIVARKPA